MDLVEKAGSGILRINQAMREYGLMAPKIEADANWFSVTFTRPDLQKRSYEERKRLNVMGAEKDIDGATKKITEKVTENQKVILAIMARNARVTAKELASKVGISERTIKENIKKLKGRGRIERIGPAKGGYWEVKGQA
jgi:ATP-dependent DNA helicase RecG